MKRYCQAAMGRAMKDPGSNFARAMAKKLTWWHSAEGLGLGTGVRQMRSWRWP